MLPCLRRVDGKDVHEIRVLTDGDLNAKIKTLWVSYFRRLRAGAKPLLEDFMAIIKREAKLFDASLSGQFKCSRFIHLADTFFHEKVHGASAAVAAHRSSSSSPITSPTSTLSQPASPSFARSPVRPVRVRITRTIASPTFDVSTNARSSSPSPLRSTAAGSLKPASPSSSVACGRASEPEAPSSTRQTATAVAVAPSTDDVMESPVFDPPSSSRRRRSSALAKAAILAMGPTESSGDNDENDDGESSSDEPDRAPARKRRFTGTGHTHTSTSAATQDSTNRSSILRRSHTEAHALTPAQQRSRARRLLAAGENSESSASDIGLNDSARQLRRSGGTQRQQQRHSDIFSPDSESSERRSPRPLRKLFSPRKAPQTNGVATGSPNKPLPSPRKPSASPIKPFPSPRKPSASPIIPFPSPSKPSASPIKSTALARKGNATKEKKTAPSKAKSAGQNGVQDESSDAEFDLSCQWRCNHLLRCHSEKNEPDDEDSGVFCVAFPSTGGSVFASAGSNCVCVINAMSGQVLKKFKVAKESFFSVVWTTTSIRGKDAEHLILASGELGDIYILSTSFNVCFHIITSHTRTIASLILMPSYNDIIVGSAGRFVQMHHLGNVDGDSESSLKMKSTRICHFTAGSEISQLSAAKDGQCLLASTQDEIEMWSFKHTWRKVISDSVPEGVVREGMSHRKFSIHPEDLIVDSAAFINDTTFVSRPAPCPGNLTVTTIAGKGVKSTVLEYPANDMMDMRLAAIKLPDGKCFVVSGDVEGRIHCYHANPVLADMHMKKAARPASWVLQGPVGPALNVTMSKDFIIAGYANNIVAIWERTAESA